MHFSIPDSVELYDSGATTYTAYNIFINGSYHCCLRYKQLYALNEQLKHICDAMGVQLPAFPPKRLLPLTNSQLEVRRAALEHYLQLLGQDTRISKLAAFEQFLQQAQLETAATSEDGAELEANIGKDLTVELLLANSRAMTVPGCRLDDNSSTLLRKSCEMLQLPHELLQYFSLYLVHTQRETNALIVLRKLQDFEAPLLSARHACMLPCQIMLRKSYWSTNLDATLLRDAVGLNLLYLQTASDVQREWIIAGQEAIQRLQTLQEQGLKREYIEFCTQLPLYGSIQFSARSLVDYPDPQTHSLVSIGNRELSLRNSKSGKIFETKFRITRMRCWRLTAIHGNSNSSMDETAQSSTASYATAVSVTPNLQLSFEYLMANKKLRWITINSAQAMLMAVCLQEMVDELLNGSSSSSSGSQPETKAQAESQQNNSAHSLTYLTRNGLVYHSNVTAPQSSLSSTSSTPSLSNEDNTPSSLCSNTSSSSNSNFNVRQNSNASISSTESALKFVANKAQRSTAASNNLRSQNPKIANSNASYCAVLYRNVLENEAFEGIGDDDL